MDFAAEPPRDRQEAAGVAAKVTWAWALAGWLLAQTAWAAPADDFQRGQLAYHRGDVVGAMGALRPAAQAGHAPSQVLLAFILERADFSEEAVALYRQAAAQGDAEGHAGLANACLSGRGVAKDEKLAALHFSKAADGGHALAIDAVATAWLRGQWGLDAQADPATARAAVQRAAERGHLPSAEALVQAYQQGQLGLAVNPAEGARWQATVLALRKQRSARPAPPASQASR
jgi:TPR repeat protein